MRFLNEETLRGGGVRNLWSMQCKVKEMLKGLGIWVVGGKLCKIHVRWHQNNTINSKPPMKFADSAVFIYICIKILVSGKDIRGSSQFYIPIDSQDFCIERKREDQISHR